MSMDFRLDDQPNHRFTLRTGRKITLQSLDQRLTYAGLLEGVPSSDWNDQIIEKCLEKASQTIGPEARPVLIPPARRDHFQHPGDMAGVRMRRGHRAEWLPTVICVAVFRGDAPARDQASDGSMLTMVWFQDDYAFPIDESVLPQIQAIDWERLAIDFDV